MYILSSSIPNIIEVEKRSKLTTDIWETTKICYVGKSVGVCLPHTHKLSPLTKWQTVFGFISKSCTIGSYKIPYEHTQCIVTTNITRQLNAFSVARVQWKTRIFLEMYSKCNLWQKCSDFKNAQLFSLILATSNNNSRSSSKSHTIVQLKMSLSHAL